MLPLLMVACLYCIVEGLWLYLMGPFYTARFAEFSKSPLALYDLVAAGLSYAALLGGFWFLVLEHVADGRPWAAFLRGAGFGLVVYGVYNMTNRATLRGYSWPLALTDLTWGTLVFGTMAWVYVALKNR